MDTIFTIGHSNHSSEVLVGLLIEVKIEMLVDIRSNPISPWVQYANPHDLNNILKTKGIQYLYLGDVLGGRPNGSDCYNPQTGKVDYRLIQKKKSFQQGIRLLLGYLKDSRVCIMCAEEDPSHCHRNLLVGESLRREGVLILHIRGNGQIQTDEDIWKCKAGVEGNQLSLPL